MGIFEKIFGKFAAKEPPANQGDFKMLRGYSPVFSSFDGSVYELALTRAAVDAIARQVSKLEPVVTGSANRAVAAALKSQPNPYMDTTKFLYRTSAILESYTTCFIFPMTDDYGRINGFYPALPSSVRAREVKGELWLEVTFPNGQNVLFPYELTGILTKFQMENDLFGDGNAPIAPTMELIDSQNQALTNAIETSAAIDWLVKVAGQSRPDDLKKKRDQFAEDNLASSNKTGVMIYDTTWEDVRPIERKQYTIDFKQMELIKSNVYTYFGVNEDILQNKFNEDVWTAFYESKIEPFQKQLSLVLTNMTYSARERAQGNAITFLSSSIDYMSNATKSSLCTSMADRGAMCADEFREKFGMPPVPDGSGQKFAIRGEYILAANLGQNEVSNEKQDEGVENDAS